MTGLFEDEAEFSTMKPEMKILQHASPSPTFRQHLSMYTITGYCIAMYIRIGYVRLARKTPPKVTG